MKRFKDPIYGYIEIDGKIAENIIDTAEFQRLRQIIQTSYAPLYASAVHNRFVHSLGVYHLGQIVTSVIGEIDGLTIDLNRYKEVFEYACLLHDIGHAPFSHTGEFFYLGEGSSRKGLHQEIINLTSDPLLESEIEKCNYAAAPHELMSIVVALKNFEELFTTDEERSFFARCISGYSYSTSLDINKSFLNCLISMLNSPLIDVDKLDYLIRDAYITGFDTVSIDYERLLKSVNIIVDDDSDACKLTFSKAAVSVIENVVFAHDAERKWIQNHPVVQYESFILKYAMEKLNSCYQNLFSYDSLSQSGNKISDNYNVSLLSDNDIIFLMKNYLSDDLICEYFARNKRRHPLWKSESEYKAIFKPWSNDNLEKLENEFEELAKYLNFMNMSSVINSDALSALEEDIKKSELELHNESDKSGLGREKNYQKQIENKKKHLKWIKCLKDFSDNQNIDFDFVIIKADQFNSGFGKVAFDEIEVYFPETQITSNFKEITNTLSFAKSSRDKFYYIFYRRNSGMNVDVKDLVKRWGNLAMQECYIES